MGDLEFGLRSPECYAMVADSSEAIAAPHLSKPQPRTVPYYGISNQESAEGAEEYFSEDDFDIEEALEQLDAANEYCEFDVLVER